MNKMNVRPSIGFGFWFSSRSFVESANYFFKLSLVSTFHLLLYFAIYNTQYCRFAKHLIVMFILFSFPGIRFVYKCNRYSVVPLKGKNEQTTQKTEKLFKQWKNEKFLTIKLKLLFEGFVMFNIHSLFKTECQHRMLC